MIIDEANVPPSSDATEVFSNKLPFTATAAARAGRPAPSCLSAEMTTEKECDIGKENDRINIQS